MIFWSEDLGADEKVILKWMLRKLVCEGEEWIHLAQDIDR
jgi:hypothetical protein